MQSIARELEMNVHVIDMYSTCELEKHVAIWIKQLVDANKPSEEILEIIRPAIYESNGRSGLRIRDDRSGKPFLFHLPPFLENERAVHCPASQFC